MMDPKLAELDDVLADLDRPLTRASAALPGGERNILRPVDHGSERGRATPVRVQPANQRPMRGTNGLLGSSRLKAKDLIGFLLSHLSHADRRRTLPRCRIELHVLTPSGRPAVEILSEQV